jgi:precorrin-6B C5,15-methyltransferase / cobalt-precorrin-6B C5,C15-methyltransferase
LKPWLTIIGIGEDGYEGLGAAARLSLQQVKTIVGSKRTLAITQTTKNGRNLSRQLSTR